jgi:hypothetical protein
MRAAWIVAAGVLGLAVARTKRRPPRPSCTAWAVPTSVPASVARRAKEILAGSPEYGTELVEEWDGQVWKFVVETHGPNDQNPRPHKGVGVRLCADAM